MNVSVKPTDTPLDRHGAWISGDAIRCDALDVDASMGHYDSVRKLVNVKWDNEHSPDDEDRIAHRHVMRTDSG